ncbi:dTDP-4-dehydrorhamnose 3,5-epimerase [Pontixanthobacter sp.]|uniref:dTDP-4-dehydrorhamnose 3,5-epimerase n=1 Tax=Pontixanthobacter sp. TaxID=2792078 RepID=UPI003C7BE9CD
MDVKATYLNDIKIIAADKFHDDRGWFSESWSAAAYADQELGFDWVQDNHSFSAERGTLRGLHYQNPPHAQDKLVRCTRGSIWDVAVDFRKKSPTFMKHVTVVLSAENGRQLLVPKGFLHGFLTLTSNCEVQYKCSDYYAPDCDATIRWNDPDLAIDWPIDFEPNLSEKDSIAPFVTDTSSPF